jgi:hypothetical protein
MPMKSVYLLLLLIVGLSGRPADADVTVCNGNDCTIVSGDTIRKMTAEEVRRKRQDESWRTILNADCSVARDEERCRNLKTDLLNQFSPTD